MEQYIKKSALVTKIEEKKRKISPNKDWYFDEYTNGYVDALKDILSFLDTIKAKEIDMEESARNYLLNKHKSPLNEVFHQVDLRVEMQYHKDIERAFKTGFELGLISKGE